MLRHCHSGNRHGILNEAEYRHLFDAYTCVIVIGKCQNWHHSRVPLFECIIRKKREVTVTEKCYNARTLWPLPAVWQTCDICVCLWDEKWHRHQHQLKLALLLWLYNPSEYRSQLPSNLQYFTRDSQSNLITWITRCWLKGIVIIILGEIPWNWYRSKSIWIDFDVTSGSEKSSGPYIYTHTSGLSPLGNYTDLATAACQRS
jgi:hypothetical protein